MERLKYKLREMLPDTTSYSEMYDGLLLIFRESRTPEKDFDPTYYNGDIGFKITGTHKLAQDKPTVTCNIPVEILKIKDTLQSEFLKEAAADHLLRKFIPYIDELNKELYNRSRPDNENGKYYLYHPGGEVVSRNTAYFALCPQRDYEYLGKNLIKLIDDGAARPPRMCLCIRMQVQLPKRKIRKTIQMLCCDLPAAAERFVTEFDPALLKNSLELAEKQEAIRRWLKNSDYCAFIANGSILARAKGTDLPMDDAVLFKSPPGDEIEICGVLGMGIKKGVTVITGGGYSGKSTLLDAVAAGIYNHISGDGRELCITDHSAVTISAEDGRSVKHINISPFIKWLSGEDTSDFSTDHASGSTSQAANIMEAIDCGAKLLLIDEDRSATNFMIQDRLMKELIKKEPITPFTERANELYKANGVSTILVIGGSGEYLSVANKIYIMEDYLIHDVTEKAGNICCDYKITQESIPGADWTQHRRFYPEHFTSYPEGSGSEMLEVSDTGFIFIGDEKIDVRGLHNIITPAQLDALGFMLRYLEITLSRNHEINIVKEIDELYAKIHEEGLDTVYSSYFTTCRRFLDLPRKQELFMLINRMRKINCTVTSIYV